MRFERISDRIRIVMNDVAACLHEFTKLTRSLRPILLSKLIVILRRLLTQGIRQVKSPATPRHPVSCGWLAARVDIQDNLLISAPDLQSIFVMFPTSHEVTSMESDNCVLDLSESALYQVAHTVIGVYSEAGNVILLQGKTTGHMI